MKPYLDVIADYDNPRNKVGNAILLRSRPDLPLKEEVIMARKEAMIKERSNTVKIVKGIIRQHKI